MENDQTVDDRPRPGWKSTEVFEKIHVFENTF